MYFHFLDTGKLVAFSGISEWSKEVVVQLGLARAIHKMLHHVKLCMLSEGSNSLDATIWVCIVNIF
jgi:hypothetical protein